KFYYAGGSCRYMFEYSTAKVKKVVKSAMNSVWNKTVLIKYCNSIFHPDLNNRLYGL
ncbi:Crinkler (CRN), partial [Phytophthora megakarya]